MRDEELKPHVDEIMEAIGDKVSREQIFEEMKRYVTLFRLNIDMAKRTIVKRFGGEDESIPISKLRKLATVQPGEMSVNIIGKIVSTNEKEIESRGERKKILYGLIGDESATLSYTAWKIPEPKLQKGEVVSIRNAYTTEYQGRVQLNLGSRTGIKKEESAEIRLQDIPLAPAKPAKIGEINESSGSVEITGRILSVEKKIVGGDRGPREILTGMIGDETGRIRFTSWGDARLKEDDVVKINGASVRFWKGIPQLNFDDRAEITRIKSSFPTAEKLMESPVTEIFRLIEGPGAIDITVAGIILQIREGSGLIFRCPECKRVLQKGSCRIHGKIDGIADLRVKAVLDDGTGALSVIMNRELTENLIEMSIDECIEKARGVMDYDIIRDSIEEKLIARPVEVRGNVMVDEYGPMMIAQHARLIDLDAKEKAEKLLLELEGSE